MILSGQRLMTYWDTSALLKLYVHEADSGFFVNLLRESESPVCTSSLTSIELLCAANRKEHARDLRPGEAAKAADRFLADSKDGNFVHVPCGNEIILRTRHIVQAAFKQSRPIMIRSLDAIHVASALAAGAQTLVTTDRRLRAVAESAGLTVFPG